MTAAPSTNDEFLSAIFGTLPPGEFPMVCGFSGDPGNGQWAGWPWTRGIESAEGPGINWYLTLATYRADGTGKARRTAAQCERVFGLLLDDVGTKAEPLWSLPLLPSAVVETSPGNYQAIYLFDLPVMDRAVVRDLQSAVVRAGFSDPGAQSPETRYCRLPFAVNGKHSPPFPCRLVEWRPSLRYSIDAIVAGLGLDLTAAPPKARTGTAPPSWSALVAEERERITLELQDALAAIPADDRDIWQKVGHYLKGSLPEDLAFSLWSAWSETSEKCNPEGLEQFDTFAPTHCNHRAVFALAAGHGWVNPRASAARDYSAVGFGQGVTLPAGASLAPIQRLAANDQPFKRQVGVATRKHL